MANLFNQNPMILDTAWTTGTIPAALTALLNGPPQSFLSIIWVAPANIGDQLTITDASGIVLFNKVASVANLDIPLWDKESQRYTFKQSKWVLSQRDSGKLYLWK